MSSVNRVRPTVTPGSQRRHVSWVESEISEKPCVPGDLIKLREAALVADGVHPTTVRRWIARGILKAYRRLPSGALYVSKADVIALVQPVESGGAA